MNAPVISPRFAVLLGALAVALFSLSVIFTAGEDPSGLADDKAGPGAYSTSSLGYAALYDLLSRSGWSVERGDFSRPPAGPGLTIYAEPSARERTLPSSSALRGGDVLVVLPKWRGTRMPGRSRWIGSIEPVPIKQADDFLARFCGGGVVRVPWPRRWGENLLDHAPEGMEPLQLVVSGALEPLVATSAGILAGSLTIGERRIVILSDPDVIANHGLVRCENAAFALALVEAATGGKRMPLRFDESLHGYGGGRKGSPLTLLFTRPFVAATVLLFLTAALLVWAGGQRFGRPHAAGDGPGFGKLGLLDNSARLMEYAGHGNDVLQHYVTITMRRAGEALHAPPGLGADALAGWLDGIGKARGAQASCRDILVRARNHPHGEAGRTELLRLARDMRRWSDAVLATSPQNHIAGRRGDAADHHNQTGRRAG